MSCSGERRGSHSPDRCRSARTALTRPPDHRGSASGCDRSSRLRRLGSSQIDDLYIRSFGRHDLLHTPTVPSRGCGTRRGWVTDQQEWQERWSSQSRQTTFQPRLTATPNEYIVLIHHELTLNERLPKRTAYDENPAHASIDDKAFSASSSVYHHGQPRSKRWRP